jgi:hypothetical protein
MPVVNREVVLPVPRERAVWGPKLQALAGAGALCPA